MYCSSVLIHKCVYCLLWSILLVLYDHHIISYRLVLKKTTTNNIADDNLLFNKVFLSMISLIIVFLTPGILSSLVIYTEYKKFMYSD